MTIAVDFGRKATKQTNNVRSFESGCFAQVLLYMFSPAKFRGAFLAELTCLLLLFVSSFSPNPEVNLVQGKLKVRRR